MTSKEPTAARLADPEGRALVPARDFDSFEHKPVWAVYKFRADLLFAEECASDFSDLATANTTANAYNRKRRPGETHQFRVCRFAIQLGPASLASAGSA